MVEVAWWVNDCYQNQTEMAVMGVSGALGSGKTHGGAQWHHLRVLQNQESPFSGWMEPTYSHIRVAAIPTYKRVLSEFGYSQGKDYDVLWTPYPRIIYRRSKHEVIFWSGDNPENVCAFELSHASIDEAGACHIDSSRHFRGRVRHPGAKIRQSLVFGAPQGVTGFAEEFDSDTLPNWEPVTSRKHRHTEKNWWRYVLWSDDNPHLPPSYIQSLMDTYGHNPNLIKSYRYGLFCPLVEGAAYSNYNPQKHDVDDVEADPFKDLFFTLDFNANPMAWASAQKVWQEDLGPYGYTRKLKLRLTHESSGKSADLDDAVAEFASKHPVDRFAGTQIYIYGDRSGHSQSHRTKRTDYEQIAYYLKELGYKNVTVRAAKVNPAETDSVGSVQRMFLEDTLLVCKRLKNVKRSLLATTWKENTRKIDKPANDTWTHWMDAVKYLVHQIQGDFETGIKIYGKN